MVEFVDPLHPLLLQGELWRAEMDLRRGSSMVTAASMEVYIVLYNCFIQLKSNFEIYTPYNMFKLVCISILDTTLC